jgi:hypothetical protein
MLSHRGEQILARFPGPVTVKPVLTPSVGFCIAFAVLVVAGTTSKPSRSSVMLLDEGCLGASS